MRKPRILAGALFISGVLSLPSNSVAQTNPTESSNENGSICVLPNSPEPPTRISPGGEYNPKTLTLRIDKQEPIRWPHKEPVLIDGLDLQTNHLVVLTSDGKRIHSFRFKFSEDDDAKLCIYFDGYQGVQLGNRKNADWCRVKVRACWRKSAPRKALDSSDWNSRPETGSLHRRSHCAQRPAGRRRPRGSVRRVGGFVQTLIEFIDQRSKREIPDYNNLTRLDCMLRFQSVN